MSSEEKTEKSEEIVEGATAASDDNVSSADDNVPTADDKQETKEAFSMDWLRKYFAKSLGIYYGPEPEVLLDEVSFEGIARYLKSEKCQKVVTMVGAGISTSAGLPDFRTPGSGMYAKLEKYNLSRPEQAFDITFFKENPEPYYMIRREMFAAQVKPTPCHYFIKMLENKNKLLRHFTQNIDGLERDAGISEDRLVEAHGSYRTSHCMKCNKQFMRDFCIDKMFDETAESVVPHCDVTDCNGVIKPDVVFFGEKLPNRFAERVCDIDDCDLLIIMGTSLVVQPFNTLTNRTKENTPRLYINMENSVGGKRHPVTVLFFGGGFDFNEEDNIRDVYWQGKCDDGCYALADLMGWGEELREMVSREHERIENEWRATGKIPKVKTATTPSIPMSQSKPREVKNLSQNKPDIGNDTKGKRPLDNQRRNESVQELKGVTKSSALHKDKQTGGHSARPSSTVKGTVVPPGGRRNALPKKS